MNGGMMTRLLIAISEDEKAARPCPDDALGALSTWVELGSDEVDQAEAHFKRHPPSRILRSCVQDRLLLDLACKIGGTHGQEIVELMAKRYGVEP